MARWTFLRHGESEANAAGWLAGHTDVALTARGEQEALAIADTLRDVPFERVLVSDLRRTLRTLELAVPDWRGPTVVDARLRERTIGAWDGHHYKEQQAMALLTTWNVRPPGGESHADLGARALAALADLDAPVDTLVVSHGGFMRVVLGLLDGRPHDQIGLVRYPNCSVQTREVAPGTWAALAHTLRAHASGSPP